MMSSENGGEIDTMLFGSLNDLLWLHWINNCSFFSGLINDPAKTRKKKRKILFSTIKKN